MANIGDLVVQIDADTSGLESGMVRAQRATKNFSQSARGGAAGFARIARESQAAVPPIGNLTSMLGTLTGLLGAREVIQYADAWNNAANQLRQVTDTASELAGVQETLMGVANDTRSEFESTANLYSRLARSTTEMGLSQKELIGLTKTINQSFAVSGATATEAAAAITQLSQGLAAGALRGDEFNSVSEQAPALMRAISESLDMTIGDLREFAAEGGITAEIVVNALQESADSIENDFGKAVATFGQQMTVARNNMLQFVGGSNDLNQALSNLGETAITLSENLDLVVQAGGLLASLIAGRMLGRLVALAGGLTTAAGAATALRTALAFLGGPAGIAVAAAGALFTFREELGLIASPADDARKEVELLTGAIEGMNKASVETAMIAINAQLFELEKRARETREELEAIGDQSGSGALGMAPGATGAQARAQAELGQIGAERGALMEQMESLQRFGQELENTTDKLVPTKEQAGLLGEEIKPTVKALETAASSADSFATEAEGAARRLAAVSTPGGSDPRYSLDPDEGTFESRARARFEASAFRLGDPATINLGGNPGARSTGSTAAYDAAGSIAPSSATGRAANQAMGDPKNIGTLTFKLQGDDQDGETDVTGDANDLKRLADLFSGVSASA